MAQREGSVYLTLFIIMLLLFGVMAVFFITTNAKRTEANNQLSALRSRLEAEATNVQSLSDTLSDLRVAVGGPTYEDEASWPGDLHFTQTRLESIEASYNEAVKELGDRVQIPESDFQYLVEPYDHLQSLLAEYRKLFAEMATRTDEAQKAVQVAETDRDNTVAAIQTKNKELADQVSDLEVRLEELDSSSKQKEEEYLLRIEQLNDTYGEDLTRSRRLTAYQATLLSNMGRRLQSLEEQQYKEQTLEDVDPDGLLLVVDSDARKGWIDLGRSDFLRKGLIFRVYQLGKGGRPIHKGQAEVRAVQENQAEVSYEEVDSLNPITAGDFVSSPLFDPEKKPVFVFAGRSLSSDQFSLDFVKNMIGSNGGIVEPRVDLNTDFVILIDGYETSQEYRTAREYGVVVIRERDLLSLLGI